MRCSILVTDGEERSALAIVRSLGLAGHRVYVCSSRSHSLAGASRYSIRQAAVPNPLAVPRAFGRSVRELVRAWGIDILVPVTEASLLALLPLRSRMLDVRIPFPPLTSFRAVSRKVELIGTAARMGVDVPSQQVLRHYEQRQQVDVKRTDFPLVLKPNCSVVEANGRRLKTGVQHIAGPADLRAALDNIPAEAYPLLLQQRIVGPGIGVFLLLWNGKVLGSFAHRRLREKPPAGGVSVYRESIAASPELIDSTRALLQAFDWQGVAMVEYKMDASSGRAFLMEVNGRFWGSLQLAIDAGVDFPALLVAAAVGDDPEPVLDYGIGVRSRWWWGDVDHLLARIRRSREALALPPGTPGRLRACRDFLARHAEDRSEVFRLDDPRPALRESMNWFRGK